MVLARQQSQWENPILLGLIAFALYFYPSLTNVACAPVRGVKVERGKGGSVRTGKRLERRMEKPGMDSKHFLTKIKWQPQFGKTQTDASVFVDSGF